MSEPRPLPERVWVGRDAMGGLFAYPVRPGHVKTAEYMSVQETEQLRSALVHAVSVIQTWHNMEIPPKQCSELWDIYWRNAPEMKPIREVLSGNPHE